MSLRMWLPYIHGLHVSKLGCALSCYKMEMIGKNPNVPSVRNGIQLQNDGI